VFLHADYSVPVSEVRAELKRILDASALWDRRGWALQVTGASERTIELRALMSAPDSATAWELRCQVREALIEFLQRRFPECLPRTRADLTGSIGGIESPGAHGRGPSPDQGDAV
jgi:hypothetical protein